MRAVIRRDNFKVEFSGRGQVWNDLLRPYFGGPQAPPESPPTAAPAAVGGPARGSAMPAPPVYAPAAAQTLRQTASAQFPPHRPENGAQPSRVAPAAALPMRPAGPSQPRTWYPPRPQPVPRAEQRFEPQRAPMQHYSAEEDEKSDTIQVEPSSDPATLYARLAAIPGRRSERDATLAAVWFLTKGEREASADEVEAHFGALHVFPDVKVVPHLLKHIHRTKMLEQGAGGPKAVRFSKKGLASVRGRLVPV